MTAAQLRERVAMLGCTLDEKRMWSGVDITIDAPEGQCFAPGLHALVTNWLSHVPEARDAALADLLQHPLEPCPPDCSCQE